MLTRHATITALSFLSQDTCELSCKNMARGMGAYHPGPLAPANGSWHKSQEALLLESLIDHLKGPWFWALSKAMANGAPGTLLADLKVLRQRWKLSCGQQNADCIG